MRAPGANRTAARALRAQRSAEARKLARARLLAPALLALVRDYYSRPELDAEEQRQRADRAYELIRQVETGGLL
ncbi:MAG: hypothetical protein ABWY78_06465 [Microvirga sp.]